MNGMTESKASADESAFSLAVRKARAITSSSLVPETYRGDNNLGNAMIALEVAERTGASPLMVMQNLYVVHGRPSWSATFLIATVNACGRFTPIRFETKGDEPAGKDYRVRAIAKDRESNEVCEGPWITWGMVEAEGWAKKAGSKWNSIPALMFMYRAAAFWTRVYAPELSLGIHTTDEVQDYVEARTVPERGDLSELQKRLEQRGQQQEPEAAPEETPEQSDELSPLALLVARMDEAQDRDRLDRLADEARELESADDRAAANAAYQRNLARIEEALAQ